MKQVKVKHVKTNAAANITANACGRALTGGSTETI